MIPHLEIDHLRKCAFFKQEVPLLNCHHVSKRESTFSAITYNTIQIITKFEELLNRSGGEGVGASSARISRLQP